VALYDYNIFTMKHTPGLTVLVATLFASASLSLAQEATSGEKSVKTSTQKIVLPAGITEEMLAPPPMPRFMLEKPGKPLTIEEMTQQAREAEKKAAAASNPIESKSKETSVKPAN
jgi:hypothetical protein